MLSDREVQIARDVAAGRITECNDTVRRVADQVGIGLKTSGTHALQGITQYVSDVDEACDALRADEDWGYDE